MDDRGCRTKDRLPTEQDIRGYRSHTGEGWKANFSYSRIPSPNIDRFSVTAIEGASFVLLYLALSYTHIYIFSYLLGSLPPILIPVVLVD